MTNKRANKNENVEQKRIYTRSRVPRVMRVFCCARDEKKEKQAVQATKSNSLMTEEREGGRDEGGGEKGRGGRSGRVAEKRLLRAEDRR